MNSKTGSITHILVVEDNPIDVRLLRFALERETEWPTVMVVAEDGEKAIELLKQSVASGTPPDFVVLDLNLPKRDGTEVLQWIRGRDALRGLPVAIVSSSPLDVMQLKVSGASVEADCYFVKPMDVDVFLALAKQLMACYLKAHRPRALE